VSFPSVSICAPAYDEEGAIDGFLDDCWEALEGSFARAPLDYEVIVVDDGSRDGTHARLAARAAEWPRLRVLRHPENRGLGAAWSTIYAAASKELIFLVGSDGQWRCADLWPMLDEVVAGAGVVVGVRGNKEAIYTPGRRAVSRAYRLAVRALFGVDLHDAGSLKLGPREVFDRPLVSTGVFCDAERLLRAAREGRKLAFVPCSFHPRRTGRATGARRDVVVRAAIDLGRTFIAFRR
jgi:glycosyltransferase involved in cell wall biosynthesis